jgi:hypothetical protein
MMHSGQAEQSSMVFGLLRSPFRVVLSALNQKRLVVVEGDALDDAGEFLGGGFAFWDCGVHAWGFIFRRTVCLG